MARSSRSRIEQLERKSTACTAAEYVLEIVEKVVEPGDTPENAEPVPSPRGPVVNRLIFVREGCP
jgi:hypothetical protein